VKKLIISVIVFMIFHNSNAAEITAKTKGKQENKSLKQPKETTGLVNFLLEKGSPLPWQIGNKTFELESLTNFTVEELDVIHKASNPPYWRKLLCGTDNITFSKDEIEKLKKDLPSGIINNLKVLKIEEDPFCEKPVCIVPSLATITFMTAGLLMGAIELSLGTPYACWPTLVPCSSGWSCGVPAVVRRLMWAHSWAKKTPYEFNSESGNSEESDSAE
jgi:hypothetical protein